MTFNHSNNEYLEIYNFVDDFTSIYQINTDNWRQIIDDTRNYFYGFSYLVQYLFQIIDFRINFSSGKFQFLIIKDLSSNLRKDIYIELTNLQIDFTKKHYYIFGDIDCDSYVDICIPITNIWTITDFRKIHNHYLYSYKKDIFDEFYHKLKPLFILNCAIIVSMVDFIQFKKIFNDIVFSYNNQNNTLYYVDDSNDETSNNNIKHQLSDMIFDIKHKITDLQFKQILESISNIHD